MIAKNIVYNSAKRHRIKTVGKRFANLFENKIRNNIIVSLTSYNERLSIVHYSIESIIDQTLQPDSVVLYLSESKNEVKKYKEILKLQDRGLRIIYDCPNILGHKKYYWAMQDFNDSIIITIDDDVVYSRRCIESLLAQYKLYPDSVIARRVNRILYQKGQLLPYNQWHFNYRFLPSRPLNSLLATGVGAVLYPPHILDKITFDLSLIKKYSLTADDIWLKVCEALYGIKVTWAPCFFPHPFSMENTVNTGLAKYNVVKGNNDVVLNDLLNYFNLSKNIFQD